MNRFIMLLIVLTIISLNGCAFDESSLSEEQQKAVNNCIEFIENSSFTAKDTINTDIVKMKNATDKTWESVWNEGGQIDQNEIDSSDWIITIGDTAYVDFTILVCDSDTYEVVGYIPIE